MLDYWQSILGVMGQESSFIKRALANATYQVKDGQIQVGLATEDQVQVVKTRYDQAFKLKLAQNQLNDWELVYLVDDKASEQAKLQAQQHLASEVERERQELAQLEQRRQEQSKVVVENTDIPQIGKDIPDTPAISIQEVYEC